MAPPVVAVAQDVPAVVPASAPDVATAARYAEVGGEPVVVESATTETDEVRANPDGTMTLIQHVQPVRVRRGDGWVPVDLTLERRPDGTYGPKASAVDVVFSGGGPGSAGQPLARIVRGGRELGLKWDVDLPVPVAAGPVLTYPEALPGVDLRLEAHLKGFSELLVVKTPEAADNPALERIAFGTHAEGVALEVGPRPDGDLVAEDSAGEPVFVGAASRMWDSSARAGGVATVEPGDRQAGMGVEVTSEAVVITPDRAFLDDPATTYPVVLDPEYRCPDCGKVHHVVVQSPWPAAKNFDATGGDLADLKAGYATASMLNAPSNGVSRTYLRMHTASLAGRFIHRAALHTRVINSYSCSPTAPATELYLANWVDAGTTWGNQPGWAPGLLSSNNRSNNAQNCPGDGGADFDAVVAVRAAAANRWGETTLVLKSAVENSLDGWRRFDINPYLEVVYNSYPDAPSHLGMEGWGPHGADALPCVVGADRPALFTRTPRLRAMLKDPDHASLDAGFRVMRGTVDSHTWNGQDIHVGNIPSGSFAQVTVPQGWITTDGVHTWHLWSGDYQLSSWSQNCEFEVDTRAPNTPAVSSADYPATGVHGSVGRTGAFTFRVNGNTGLNGGMDVRRYGWSLNNDTATTHMVDVGSADGTVTVPITPRQVGTNVLYVSAFDKAGNRSATNAVYAFRAAEPAGPKASWSLDETSGTAAADSAGNRPLSLAGAASFAPGYEGNALALNGTSGYAASASAVLDTSRAYSVSVWARLDRDNGFFTALSQDGNRVTPFFLQYADDVDRWSFAVTDSDTDGYTSARVFSSAPPRLGVWTHLLGTFEPDTGRTALYVDGKLQGATTGTSWESAGGLVVGATKWRGDRLDHFAGALDRVRAWDRELSAEQAADEANTAVPRARFALDEQAGTTTVNEVSGQPGTLSGGVSWAGAPVDPDDPDRVMTSEDKWLNFDASWTGQVAAPSPANLRTDRSYTVSAWVRHSGLDAASRAAVGFGDAQHSPFMLGYRKESGKWGFLMSKGTGGDGWFALSDRAAQANRWVHLVGVYDAPKGRMTLYVNGQEQGTFLGTADGAGVTGWHGSGPLWVGRGIWTGQHSDAWKGDVDDVRVHSGVLTTEQVIQQYFTTLH
ncbi:LamG domain-containing protein [Saccharothrix xinjiangensis]